MTKDARGKPKSKARRKGVAIYCRTSTKANEHGDSKPRQIALGTGCAKAHRDKWDEIVSEATA